jgi:aryl sulfotransferase
MPNHISWLASFPKSGNTGLRMTLAAYQTDGPVDINLPITTGTDDCNPYFYHAVCPADMRSLTDDEKSLLRPAALLHVCSLVPEGPLFLKTHHANVLADGIELIPSVLTKGAVYLVRDPRDVAVSLAEHLNKPIDQTIELMNSLDFAIGRDGIVQTISSWSLNVKSWLHAKFPHFVVKYEDLFTHPHENFAKIIKFLGIPLDGERLIRAVQNSSFAVLQEQEQKRGFREVSHPEQIFFRRGKAGGWKGVLSAAQADRIVAHHGEVMRELNYVGN